MKKFLLITFFTVLTFCLLLCACQKIQQSQYYVKYVIDGEQYTVIYADFGEKISPPEITEQNNKIFKGWYTTDEYIEKWNFESDVIKDNLTLFGYFSASNEETFNILYYDGETLIHHEKVLSGATTDGSFLPPEKSGYEFMGWLTEQNKYFDFDKAINCDVTLKADRKILNFSIKFFAEGELIRELFFNVNSQNISIPTIPQKEHYSGEWEKFEFELENIVVNAVYIPITYTAVFIADGIEIDKINYTVEDEIKLPNIPQKIGYDGVWTEVLFEGNVTINAIYTPKTFTATYKVGETVIAVREFTVENLSVVPPAVPLRAGYEGKWENKELSAGNITFNAIYAAVKYNITFIADNEIIEIIQFDVENQTFTQPVPPDITGYISKWEDYELVLKDIIVNAVYTPVIYTADFYIEEIKISSVQFTIDDELLQEPQHDNRNGYSFEWSDYSIKAENLKIVGKYTPITYYVTFVVDGEIIAKLEYTVENKNIIEPPLPEKQGYSAEWESYELAFGDITVNAVYTPTETENPDNEKTKDFKFELQDDGTYSVTHYCGENKNLIIPSFYNGKPVSAVKALNFDSAKISKSEIISVEIEDGVTSIENDSFMGFSSLGSVVLPDSLQFIGNNAFAYCPFTEINLSGNILSIGTKAFAFTKIKNISLPDELKIIDDIFYNCSDLGKVILGKNTETIKTNAFFGCSSLTEIILNDNLKTICTHAFKGCASLKNITIPKSVSLIEYEAFFDTALETAVFMKTEGWIFCDENFGYISDANPERLSEPETAAYWLCVVFKSRYWKNEF